MVAPDKLPDKHQQHEMTVRQVHVSQSHENIATNLQARLAGLDKSKRCCARATLVSDLNAQNSGDVFQSCHMK
jgi:hypothetical protein